ncbi:MAG: toll/interleukin-1 receptor domain-containing protein, partial [Clostridiales bacterium]|nr:toll/interleukin-1 receptor domain-containing protein [Clostridiales bacterium]
AFSKVTLDRTQDVKAWREYLAKQLRLQQDSNKARDYGGVKLFAQKILSVLPDDFCAQFYVALADRYAENDVAFIDFMRNSSFDGVTPDELKEVTAAVVAAVEPKYIDVTKEFIARAYPSTYGGFDAILDRNVKTYIQKLRYAKVTDRDVFICHRTAEPDQDIADAICTRLEERGLRCWIAPRNILAGSQNYERDILKGVENSRLFLLVSSFKSIYSEDCEKELKAAVLEDKALYSFRIDDTPYDGAFEKALSSVQWLDAQDDPYSHLEQLVVDVRSILARDEREKAELEEKRLSAREKERVLAEARRTREQERLDRLERIVSGEIAATAAPAHAVRSRLKRAEIEIQAQNYDKAASIADDVLDDDPECACAWWILMLCDFRMPDDKTLIESRIDFTSHRY